MNGIRHSVKLEGTDSEFLLYVHASQKTRAKAINGWWWDAERRCWVYPKTARVYDAIIAEFGDDMLPCSVHRPTIQTAPPTLAIDKSESELSVVRVQLRLLQAELDEQKKLTGALQAENERLRSATASQDPAIPAVSFEQLAKGMAKEVAGQDAKFTALLDRLRLDSLLPNELVKQMERELRRILSSQDRHQSLYDLITLARDSESLTEKGIDVANTIRRHRNVLTHETTDGHTHMARVLICLFAGALLWPEFSA